MKTDRELLELAAKAAGIKLESGCLLIGGRWSTWNPLTNDGDALRLAVKLGLTIVPNYYAEQQSLGITAFTELEDSPDFCAATRRAIVRAAAEIGVAL